MIIIEPYENTNSFCTLAEAENYHATKLGNGSWTNATNEDKEKALISASLRLTQMNWIGDQYSSVQALAWPRIIYMGGFAKFYDFPPFLKSATAELAFNLLRGGAESGTSDAVKSISFSGMKMDFKDAKQSENDDLTLDVWAYIGKYINRSVKLYRC
jgi:hypothetical protein